jgi:regulator of sirC expression with transglutaminase-like and TPR domain
MSPDRHDIDLARLKALIHLLDDPDPEITRAVDEELLRLGADGIPVLETFWEQATDSVIQQRLEQLISHIQISETINQLLKWRLDGGQSLIDGWLILTRMLYPGIPTEAYRKTLKSYANRAWLMTNEHMNDWEKLAVINKFLYKVEHFRNAGVREELPDIDLLNRLLELKRGTSLGLTALYSIIAHELGIPLQVVNFNGYFALRYYKDNSHCYIDAYNEGRFFTPQNVQQFLSRMNMETTLAHYKPLSNIYIVLSMIELIRSRFEESGNTLFARRFELLAKEIEIKFRG